LRPAMSFSDPSRQMQQPSAIRRSLRTIGYALTLNCLLYLGASQLMGDWLIDRSGRIVDNDFVNVWAAGELALQGRPAAAYDWSIHREIEVAVLGHDFKGYYGWHYPPTFLFVAAGLAVLPYLMAELLWIGVTLPAYLRTVGAIMGERLGIWLGCAFPAAMWNISVGQNGFFTAALIGGVLTNISRRPILAGVLLGLLTYKPQFGILFPAVLALDGRWRVLAAATVTATALAAGSLIAFGADSWSEFFAWLPRTGAAILDDGRAGINKLQSLFGVVRWLGGSVTSAWIAQGLLIAACLTSLVLLVRCRSIPEEIKSAAVAVGALLATPYLYIYDFPVLMIPIAFLLRLGLREGFAVYELPAMAAACVLVLVFPVFPAPTGFAAAIIVAALTGARAVSAHFALGSTAAGRFAKAEFSSELR
jgi:arabinofuranan 3-O-arabinosyltransferase